MSLQLTSQGTTLLRGNIALLRSARIFYRPQAINIRLLPEWDVV